MEGACCLPRPTLAKRQNTRKNGEIDFLNIPVKSSAIVSFSPKLGYLEVRSTLDCNGPEPKLVKAKSMEGF